MWGTRHGSGKHLIWNSFPEFSQFNKIIIASEVCFALAVTAAKLSLLYTYGRLFHTPRFPIIAIPIGVIILAWPVVFISCVLFACKPIQYSWDKTLTHGVCLDLSKFYFSLSGIGVLADILLLILPIFWLWGLQMNRQKKLFLLAAFALGGFVCMAGIIRLVFIKKLVWSDITWTLTYTSVWINVECSIGIFCACLPALRPLIRRFSSSAMQSSSQNARSKSLRGSLRLPDHKNVTNNRGTIKSTLRFDETVPPLPEDDQEGAASRKHRTWYSSVVPVRTDDGEGGSMEEMVPIRKADSKMDALG